jgi:hypothetical protein
MDNNKYYVNVLRAGDGRIPRAVYVRERTRRSRPGEELDVEAAWAAAGVTERERRRRVIRHVRWQNGSIAGLLVLGVGNLAYALLR